MSFGAVAAIGGALIGADAAGDAADAQAGAAANTDATNRYIFNQQQSNQAPFREAGLTANNRLSYLLGLGPDAGSVGASDKYGQLLNAADADHRNKYGVGFDGIDQVTADAWRAQLMERARREAGTTGGGGSAEGGYGSLLKKFGMEDFEADPGYEFRRTEGMRGVEGSAAARGGLLSGAAQKAIQKYGQGLASQEYGNAYQRYNADQTNQYNRLAGIVNTGQGATNQIQNAAGQFAQNTASNNAALGNAQAAGAIGQANAWTQGIGTALGSYQHNELMKKIRNPGVNLGTATGYDLSNFY